MNAYYFKVVSRIKIYLLKVWNIIIQKYSKYVCKNITIYLYNFNEINLPYYLKRYVEFDIS